MSEVIDTSVIFYAKVFVSVGWSDIHYLNSGFITNIVVF